MGTRVDEQVPRDAELEWLLCSSEGESGVCSSFGPMVNRAMGGGGGGDDHERSVRDGKFTMGVGEGAVGKARRLRTRFLALSPEHRHTLWLAFGPHTFPREVERLGVLAGVAVETAAAQGAWAADMVKRGGRAIGIGPWLASACTRGASTVLEPIVREAKGKVLAALEAWRGGRLPRERRIDASKCWHAPSVRPVVGRS